MQYQDIVGILGVIAGVAGAMLTAFSGSNWWLLSVLVGVVLILFHPRSRAWITTRRLVIGRCISRFGEWIQGEAGRRQQFYKDYFCK